MTARLGASPLVMSPQPPTRARNSAGLRRPGRLRLLELVTTIAPGEVVSVVPPSVGQPLSGEVVEVAGLCIALATDDDIVWVHAEDSPDLVRRAELLATRSRR